MFSLTYTIGTGRRVTEFFNTREAAEAEAAVVEHAMHAVGMSAHIDGIVIAEDTPTVEVATGVQF